MGAAVQLGPSRPGAIGIVTSAGGPHALVRVLGALPGNFRLPVLVVQQRLERSIRSVAALLAAKIALPVHLAADGDPLELGVWLAPDGCDLLLSSAGLLATPPSQQFGRAGDRLLSSLADCCGERACAVVLTGNGDDGSLGLARVRDRRGLTVCQDEASALAVSLPRAARAAAQYVAPPEDIARLLVQFARG